MWRRPPKTDSTESLRGGLYRCRGPVSAPLSGGLSRCHVSALSARSRRGEESDLSGVRRFKKGWSFNRDRVCVTSGGFA